MRQKSSTTTIRLNGAERAALDVAAQSAHLGPSAYARLAVVAAVGATPAPTRRRPDLLSVAIRDLLGEVSRIGNNCNQLARVANVNGQIDRDGVAAVAAELRRLTRSVLALRA